MFRHLVFIPQHSKYKYCMKKLILAVALLAPAAVHSETSHASTESRGDTTHIEYSVTKAIFYGSSIDLSREWNPCVGPVDGGVEVHMTQQILPIKNCPGQYVVVRDYTLPDGTLLKHTVRRLSGSVPV